MLYFFPRYFRFAASMFFVSCIKLLCLKKWWNVKVTKRDQVIEYGQERPKHVAVDCDINVILN
jgi:hypothetical protein